MAGLERSGLAAEHAACCRVLEVEACIPAAGQGALAVQAAVGNARACGLAALLDDADSRAAVEAERAVVAAMGGDCHSCLAVHARRIGGAVGESRVSPFAGSQRRRAAGPVNAMGRTALQNGTRGGESAEWELLFLAATPDFSWLHRTRVTGASAMSAAAALTDQLRRDGVRERIEG